MCLWGPVLALLKARFVHSPSAYLEEFHKLLLRAGWLAELLRLAQEPAATDEWHD